MIEKKLVPIRKDWISKTLAGFVLGAVLAFGCSALFAAVFSGLPFSTRGQLAMWMVAPVWLAALSGVYFFSSGLRAWVWLGGASTLVLGLTLAFRHF